jgi:hypothetical protein
MKQYNSTPPKSVETTSNHQRHVSARKPGWAIATALSFLVLAVGVFLISDQIAQKNHDWHSAVSR